MANEISYPKFSHRGICATSADRSMEFYHRALGFEPAENYEMDDPALRVGMEVDIDGLRAQMVRNPAGITLELLQYKDLVPTGSHERRPNNQYGLTHLAFYVDDMDEAAAKVAAAGGRVHTHTRATFPEGNTTMMYCSDPDGVRVELMHNPDVPARFSHSGLCITDTERSLAFYRHALGFEAADNYDLSHHSSWLDVVNELTNVKLRAQMIRDRWGNMFELLKKSSPACFGQRERRPMDVLGLTHLCFWVDDIDLRAARVREAGGAVYPSTRATFQSGVEMIYCTDPDGIRVELLKAAP